MTEDLSTPNFQNIACFLIGVLFLNPIVSTAAELAVSAAAVEQIQRSVGQLVGVTAVSGQQVGSPRFAAEVESALAACRT